MSNSHMIGYCEKLPCDLVAYTHPPEKLLGTAYKDFEVSHQIEEASLQKSDAIGLGAACWPSLKIVKVILRGFAGPLFCHLKSKGYRDEVQLREDRGWPRRTVAATLGPPWII